MDVRERFWRGTIRGTRHRRRAAQRHAIADPSWTGQPA